ncbi:hypothetical protein D3C75_1047080 [compost metagenome]
MSNVQIVGVKRGREAIRGVVGNLDCLVHGVEGNDRQHWTEDFFASNGHGIVYVIENGRLNEEAAGFGADLFAP